VQIRFTEAAAKHGVSKAAARHVIANTTPRATRTKHGEDAWLYAGRDAWGRRIEVIAVEVEDWGKHDPYLLVIHLMRIRAGKRR
jgi:hypothetical protein